MKADCKKCINSGCCKLSIQIDKKEYDSLQPIVKEQFIKRIDLFLKKSPHLKGLENELEEMYKNNYAEMKKTADDYCPLLNKETMLCTVYENRPKTCRDYKSNKCSKIRLMSYDI